MILTCPNCASRFLLSAQVLAPSGRRVRCSSCSSLWFQLPDPDEMLADMESQIGTIPESVMPRRGNADYDLSAAGERKTFPFLSYGAAVLVFLGLLALFVVLRPAIIKSWPPATLLYEKMGLPVESDPAQQGPVLEAISAHAADEKMILIQGHIRNLGPEDQGLYVIEAILRDEAGRTLAQWQINPPQSEDKNTVLPFESRYEGAIDKVETLDLRFVPIPKNASEDADNIQAPPADAHALRPADEAH
ncbi:MAG: zinc-ribbon domain-containing protein [Alphaproteobacteria bacterium]|nr:zinc-ribbon domain-containing protein [Alphaproteobacteria bacterium]